MRQIRRSDSNEAVFSVTPWLKSLLLNNSFSINDFFLGGGVEFNLQDFAVRFVRKENRDMQEQKTNSDLYSIYILRVLRELILTG